MDFSAGFYSETTTTFAAVSTKGKAQGTLVFEGGTLRTGPKVVVSIKKH